MIGALVPAKRLDVGKSRLLPRLDRGALERLSIAMLEDVLAAIFAARAFAPVAVVTEDPAIGEVARRAGAEAHLLPDAGLNPCLDAAGAALAARGIDALLVLLGDVAGALPQDLAALVSALDALGPRAAVLARAHDGGTSALLRRPPDVIANGFGGASAERHARLAERAGVPFRALALPSLALDLDRPADIDALLTGSAGARHTRAFLAEIGWRARA